MEGEESGRDGRGGEMEGEESGRDGKNYEESESGQVGELLACGERREHGNIQEKSNHSCD